MSESEQLLDTVFDLQDTINKAFYELKLMTGNDCIDYGKILRILGSKATKAPTLP